MKAQMPPELIPQIVWCFELEERLEVFEISGRIEITEAALRAGSQCVPLGDFVTSIAKLIHGP